MGAWPAAGAGGKHCVVPAAAAPARAIAGPLRALVAALVVLSAASVLLLSTEQPLSVLSLHDEAQRGALADVAQGVIAAELEADDGSWQPTSTESRADEARAEEERAEEERAEEAELAAAEQGLGGVGVVGASAGAGVSGASVGAGVGGSGVDGAAGGAALLRRLFPPPEERLADIPQGLRDYVAWHDEQVRSPRNDTVYLVYRCTAQVRECGGLGNRLEGIISMLGLALYMRMVFAVQWDFPFPLRNSMLPALIDWETAAAQALALPKRESVYFDMYNKRYNNPYNWRLKPHLGSKRVFFATDNLDRMAALWPFVCRGLKLPASEQRTVHGPISRTWLLQVLFRPSPALEAMVLERAAELPFSLDAPYVGVHIRAGYDSTDANVTFRDPVRVRLSSLPTFATCSLNVARVMQARGSVANASEVPVLVASDMVHAKRSFLRAAKQPAVSISATGAFHTDRSRNVEHEAGIYGDRQAWLELILIAGADCKVLTHSSFSFLTAVLSRRPGIGQCALSWNRCTPAWIRFKTESDDWVLDEGLRFKKTKRDGRCPALTTYLERGGGREA
jgi:hypothetical protein